VATPRVRQAIVGLTFVSSLAMIVFVGWILPVSNQSFREVMFGGPLARGANELTIVELWHEGRNRVVIPAITGRYAFEFHFRLALAFAPLALGLFSLGAATARRKASGILTIGACALVIAFYLPLSGGRAGPGLWYLVGLVPVRALEWSWLVWYAFVGALGFLASIC
jgi:lipopolysaccharide export LptBFGC system permease protein LptF